MGFVADAFKAIASVVAPILKIVSFIPGIGQLAKLADTALQIVANLDEALKDFPKGLVKVAAKAAANLLPTPADMIAKAAIDPKEGLMGVIPAPVKEFVPNLVKPMVPPQVQELVF